MDDNLSLAEKVKERFKRMFSGVYYKRYILGLWGLFNGKWYKVKEYHYDGRKQSIQKTDQEYLEDLEEFIAGMQIVSRIYYIRYILLFHHLFKVFSHFLKNNGAWREG
jgi:hypothetical protein